jgi:aldehyde:ferredoxin oxidoreductase
MVWASGPLGGTTVPGSGTFSVVTKGSLTEGATSSQANGYFGAYLKRSGFDAIVIDGVSENWVYIYIHDGIAELRNADHLLGKDTWETEDAIKAEIAQPERGASVFSIGPAGENLVRFAAIVGDRGHVVAHNGVGAVMGSKKLKAIVTARGKRAVALKNKELVSKLNKEIIQNAKPIPPGIYEWGTSMLYNLMMAGSQLPIKNLTTGVFPDYVRFTGQDYRPRLEMKWSPCWACQARHCHIVKVLEGPYAGYIGEEPEYEALAAWGSLIGQADVGAAIMLSNEADRLGMDSNEGGWLTAMLMECYEKGIIDENYTEGLDLTWGNAEAVKTLLHKIAHRQGFGNTLAEGVMRAAQAIGGEAPNIGVYVKKGHSPRGHDHRASWTQLFDTATSSVGTIETGNIIVVDRLSAPPKFTPNSHITCLLKEEAEYNSAKAELDNGDIAGAKAGFEQLVTDSFAAVTDKSSNDPYSFWGQKALFTLLDLAKGQRDYNYADEIRVRLLSTTLTDVERFVLLNERLKYLETTSNEDELQAVSAELQTVRSKLEYFANWSKWVKSWSEW